MDLKDVRKKIDAIDNELISLFDQRKDIVLKVAALKKKKGPLVYDEERLSKK